MSQKGQSATSDSSTKLVRELRRIMGAQTQQPVEVKASPEEKGRAGIIKNPAGN